MPNQENNETKRMVCADTGEEIRFAWVELDDGTILSVEAAFRRFPHLMPVNQTKKPGENMELPLW